MKPSDVIYNKVQQMLKRQAETGHVSMYAPGYNDKLLTAILEYLDEQSERSKNSGE